MIRRAPARNGEGVRVTFVLPADHPYGRCSVVGDFNGWDPHANPFRKRSNRAFSAHVVLPADGRYRFRYLGEGGVWFDEEAADGYEGGRHGPRDCILET